MTARAVSFLIASFIFYFFANQTQIGWVFVLSVVLLVVVIVGYVLNRGILRGVSATRTLSPISDSHYEDDELAVTLWFGSRRIGVPQVQISETCPLADPHGDSHDIRMYLPYLNAQGVSFTYPIRIYRRGLHSFAPIQVRTRAPFGFFHREKKLTIETSILVYPLVKPLSRLALLDKQPMASMSYPKAGVGNEVMGVRDFRTGDSPRHIHWRSVARKGVLISKEFAEETQEGLTLFIDRYAPYDNAYSKHTPFEMGIKCAVSIADYALQRGFSLFLRAYDADFALPTHSIAWESVLQYMARVPSNAQPHLHELLQRTSVQQFVAVIVVWADERVIEPLIALKRRGINVLVIAIDGASFNHVHPTLNATSIQPLVDALTAHEIAVKRVGYGEAWDEIISA
jgi:uncharacterized protein (DUF58 family)